MAFEWLSDTADVVGGGAQIARAFKGRGESKASKQARKAAKRAGRYATAAADPTSEPFRNLAGQYDTENRRALVQAVNRIMKENARERARGGVGFGINPERRDESRYKALARSFMESRENARREARNTLLGASQGLTGSARAQPVLPSEYRQERNFDRTTTGISGAVGAGQTIGKMLEELFGNKRQVSSTTFPAGATYGVSTGGRGSMAPYFP